MSYSERLIEKIKKEYEDSVKYQEALKEVPEMILNFFKDLEYKITNEIRLSEGKISFLYEGEAGYVGDNSIIQLNIKLGDNKLTSILFTKKSENQIDVIINDNKKEPYDVITIGKKPNHQHKFCGVTKSGGILTKEVLDNYLGSAFKDILS